MTIPLPESPSPDRVTRRGWLTAWLQFPRRLVLLVLAWALSRIALPALVAAVAATRPELPHPLDWSQSLTSKNTVAYIIAQNAPNTLLLMGAALVLALAVALLLALVAAQAHRLEGRAGLLGTLLKGLGGLVAFPLAAPPGWLLCLFLVFALSFLLHLFPGGGLFRLQAAGGQTLLDRLRHLALPIVALAAFPAVVTAQAIAREVTLPRPHGGLRLWLAGLFRGLGTLLGQVGGLLGTALLVEAIFGWPGIGWVLYSSLAHMDFPVVLGALSACAVLILVGRTAAEFFRWLERLVRIEPLPEAPSPVLRRARTVYVVLALALLLIPLGLAAAGLGVPNDAVERMDRNSVSAPPSAEHPWGTDYLGRDLQSRVLRGALVSLGVAALAACVTLLLGGPIGAGVASLAERKTLLAESLADGLLWPADVLLLVPAVPAAVLLAFLFLPVTAFRGGEWLQPTLPVAIALLPRAVRAARTLWQGRPPQKRGWAIAAGLGALFLGTALATFSLVALNTFVGLGVAAPTPELGSLSLEGGAALRIYPFQLLAPGLALWACALALYMAADALGDGFSDKGMLARLNE
jgi:ABC-type dipeptide/oligopeptide/nickel transport system permease subunit